MQQKWSKLFYVPICFVVIGYFLTISSSVSLTSYLHVNIIKFFMVEEIKAGMQRRAVNDCAEMLAWLFFPHPIEL